ncbi:MAG: hypothetical protein J6Q54_02835, partial [Oscillospiraceae bacterium]|nr:hypothetical protein [Oscillospiraceae bacterium]
GAKEINEDPLYSTWAKAITLYLKQELGPIADVPVVQLNGTPKQDIVMMAGLIPFIPSAAEKYRRGGFSDTQIASYLRNYGSCMNSTRIRSGFLGLDTTYFRWLTHFARAEIFRVCGIQFEFTEVKKNVAFLKNKHTDEIIPVITGGLIHACRKMMVGAAGYTDEEGAYEAVFREEADKYVGYGVYDLVASDELQEFPKADWECILRKGDKCLSVHLPRGCDLSREGVDKAVEEAYAVIRKGYPEYADAPIHCASWLLDPGLEAFLKPDSRILQFGKRFVRYPTKSGGKAANGFVFPGMYATLEELPETTSLQRALKQHYLNGGYTYAFSGLFLR